MKQLGLINLINQYIQNWKLFILSFIICIGLACVYLFLKNPAYRIAANILVKEDTNRGGMGNIATSMMRGLSFGDMLGVGGGAVDDELEVIKSYSILYDVVKKLGLNVTYTEKELIRKKQYYDNSPLRLKSDIINMADTFLYSTKFKVKVDKNGEAQVKALYKRKIIGEAKSNFPIKISTIFGNFTIDSTSMFKIGEELSMDLDFTGYSGATEVLMRNISIKVASKKSNAINLIVDDAIPTRGKDILNYIIKRYNEYGINEKNIEANRTSVFLQKRIGLMDADLKLIEREVEKYKTENHLTDIEAEAKIILDKSSDFKEKLITVETQYSVISMIEDFLKAPENKYAVVPMSLGIEEKSAIESLLKYNDLLLERLKLLRSTHPGNPAIESMNEQVDLTRQSVLVTIQSIKRGIEYARNDLQMQERTFINRIKGMPQQEREYIEIKRQQEIKQALFIYLLQQQEENALKLAISNPKAQIIDNAFAYVEPVTPKKKLIVAVAVLFSILLPVIYLHLKKKLAKKVYTINDIQAISNLQVHSTIHSSDKQILFDDNDTSIVKEEIRNLRSNIYSMLNNSIEHKILLISSMQRNEGKSFIAFNLALSIAKTGKKVVYVDANLRKSESAEWLGLNKNSQGLYESINNNIPVEKLIQQTSFDLNLFVLPAGKAQNDASEALLNIQFQSICEKLKKQYDFVIFDSAALALYSDSMPIIELADGVIFVTRAAYTDKNSLNYIESIIEYNKIQQAICIINDVKPQK